jgi:hypothetical protein
VRLEFPTNKDYLTLPVPTGIADGQRGGVERRASIVILRSWFGLRSPHLQSQLIQLRSNTQPHLHQLFLLIGTRFQLRRFELTVAIDEGEGTASLMGPSFVAQLITYDLILLAQIAGVGGALAE